MSEITVGQSKETSIALTTERLGTFLQEARKDEAKLKRVLEMRRMKRRLRVTKPYMPTVRTPG